MSQVKVFPHNNPACVYTFALEQKINYSNDVLIEFNTSDRGCYQCLVGSFFGGLSSDIQLGLTLSKYFQLPVQRSDRRILGNGTSTQSPTRIYPPPDRQFNPQRPSINGKCWLNCGFIVKSIDVQEVHRFLISHPFLSFQSYVGRLELFDARDVTIQRITNKLPVRYKVLFPLSFPYPRLTYINYNNHILCSGDTG